MTVATVGPGDFLKVTYHGRDKRVARRDGSGLFDVVRDETTPLKLQWDSRVYEVPVGGDGFAPFEAAMVAFGDPRSAGTMGNVRDERGNVGFIADRATEVRRLRTLYDNQLGDEGEILYAPDVTVNDMEGNEVKTVLHDPSGESVIPVQQTTLDIESLLAQLQRQQRMIETLARAQGVDVNNPSLVAQEPDQPEPGEPTPEDPFKQPPEDKT